MLKFKAVWIKCFEDKNFNIESKQKATVSLNKYQISGLIENWIKL